MSNSCILNQYDKFHQNKHKHFLIQSLITPFFSTNGWIFIPVEGYGWKIFHLFGEIIVKFVFIASWHHEFQLRDLSCNSMIQKVVHNSQTQQQIGLKIVNYAWTEPYNEPFKIDLAVCSWCTVINIYTSSNIYHEG